MSDIITLFKEIAPIPKCSKNAQAMYDYLLDYAKKWNFTITTDAAQNIHCIKGTPDYCLQVHFDMVCIGDTENLEVIEKEGWLHARNSSLGADNCIGLAMMLSLMQSEEHLECLFTSDEEIGLVGARNLEIALQGKYLINLDTEDEGDISLGCAGGYDIHARFPLHFTEAPSTPLQRLRSRNFQGGHSGMDIDSGIRNAIKEAAFILHKSNARIVHICGGEKINSIPKHIEVLFHADKVPAFDPAFFELETLPVSSRPVIENSQALIHLLLSIPSGVLDYSRTYSVVFDSLNLSIIEQEDDALCLSLMGRSNTNTQLQKNMLQTQSILHNGGCQNIEIKEVYSAWDPLKSALAERLKSIYQTQLGIGEYRVIHAGFECGVLQEKFPHMEMVSFGPNIRNPHSLSERVEVASVERVFEVLKELVRS